jgi:hypothetical protein
VVDADAEKAAALFDFHLTIPLPSSWMTSFSPPNKAVSLRDSGFITNFLGRAGTSGFSGFCSACWWPVDT